MYDSMAAKGAKSWSLGLLQFSPSKNKTGECPTSMQGRLSYNPLKIKRKRKESNMSDQISPTSIHVASVQKRVELARRLRCQVWADARAFVLIGSLSFYTANLKCIQV